MRIAVLDVLALGQAEANRQGTENDDQGSLLDQVDSLVVGMVMRYHGAFLVARGSVPPASFALYSLERLNPLFVVLFSQKLDSGNITATKSLL